MQIRENFEIKPLTTYKIGGKVKKVFFPETVEEFTNFIKKKCLFKYKKEKY